MSILFVASEVGSARAVLPVAAACRAAGLPVWVVDRGQLGLETPSEWGARCDCPENSEAIDELLGATGARVLVFSSNVSDAAPLSLARRAHEWNIPCVHVLDYWNGYTSRMELDGLPRFVPDVYAVPDELAMTQAIAEGITRECIAVTGHPGLADIEKAFKTVTSGSREQLRRDESVLPGSKLLAFVSEPVSGDQGEKADSVSFRGYTEKSVLKYFFDAVQARSRDVQVRVLPHPRENVEQLGNAIESCRGDVDARLFGTVRGRGALAAVDGVVGMSSTLLYEAWLLGLPVLSLQPGLRISTLRMMQGRVGAAFFDDAAEFAGEFPGWLDAIGLGGEFPVRNEAKLHRNAARTLCEIVQRLWAGAGQSANVMEYDK